MAFQKLSADEYFLDRKQKEKEERPKENTISSFIEQKNNEKKFSKQIASDVKKQQEQEKTQEKQPFVRQPASYTEGDTFGNAANRIDNALEGLSYSTTGAVDALFGTIKQSNENNKRAKEYVEKQKKYGQKMNDIAPQYSFDPAKYELDPEYQEAKKAYDSFQRTINALRNKPLDGNSEYLDDLKQAEIFKTAALEGLSPTAQFVGGALMDVADFALTLPTALVGGPQTPLAIAAIKSAGQAAGNAAEQGMSADEALVRSALSGGATYALSKVPTERLFKLGSQPLPAGKLPAFQTVLSNSAKQGLSEGIEESGEYLFNVAADKAAGVDTPFSVQELAANAGAGALGGFVMGAGASGVGALSNRTKTVNKPGTLPETDGMETMQGSDTYAAEKDFVFDPESLVDTKTVDEQQKNETTLPGELPLQSNSVNYSKVVDDMKQRMGYQISNKEKGIVQSELKEIKSLLDNGDEAAAQKKTRELFQHITENTKVDSDLYSSDKDILDKLRTTKVYVSKETRGSIPDYADYAKKNFSRLSLTSDPSAIPVDVFYSELQEQYPHLFDSSVVNPADQLVRMGEVASSRSPKKISLSEYIGNNKEKRAEYQKEFFKSIYPIVAGKEYSEPGKLPGVDSGRYSDVGSFGENTVGSAEYDPNSLQALADQYGYVPTGGGPKSGIAIVPKAIDDSGKKTSTFARTAIEAIGTSPETVKKIENDILSGKYGYTPGTNQELVQRVGDQLSKDGFEKSYKKWNGIVYGNSRIKREDIMLGTYLAMIADQNGNTKLASEIYADMAAIGTEQGQTVQAFSILKKMGAPAQMRYIDTIVERLNNQKRQQNSPIVIDEELRTELLNAKGQEEIDAVVDKMKDNIVSQINTSWMDKLTALRYMSMLGNPRTHIRNILGNAAFRVAVGIKNIIGTGLEAGVSKIPGVEFERTKSLLTPNDKPLVDYAKRVFDEETTGGSKYNDKNDIENRKNVFKTKALEKARRGIFNSLEAEDKIFRKNAFSRSMAGYLKANGVTPENINSFENIGLVNRAKAYAEQEALKTTFQDASMVADVLNSIKKVHPELDFFVSGVQPFLRTPINIAKRGIEYSPVGLLNGGKDLAKALKKGYSPAEALDEMAAGLTGTGIMALGAWLSDIGVLNAGREDQEKLAAMDDATGVQEYSLVIPGEGSYTIDWLAPAVMPLFVGAELYQTMTDEGATMEDVLGTITRITEPMLQMSMMSSLDSALRSAVYSSDNVGAGVLQVAAKSYLGQYIPTVAGQVARTIDDTRRTSYVEPGAQFPNVESFLQQQQAKIPGLSQNLPPRLNVWGEEDVDDNFGSRLFQNMVSPGYWENDTSTDVERTLESIYRETGDAGVLPRYAAKDFALLDGRTKELSSEEYTKLSKEFGQNSNQILSELFENQDFFSLDAEMQAAMIEDVYKYSLDLAKDDVSGNSFLQDGDATLELFDSGFPVSTYFLTKAQLDSFTGEGSTQQKRDALFAMDGMSGEEKNEFAKLYFDSEKEIDYSNADTYAMTQLSDAGQNKYNRVESLGYSVQKYAELYPIAAASEKKAIVISNLMAAGLTEAQAMEFYRRIKKQDWDE
nr:MAG TPA: hypothetical protein [Caudoviricetes sp.]